MDRKFSRKVVTSILIASLLVLVLGSLSINTGASGSECETDCLAHGVPSDVCTAICSKAKTLKVNVIRHNRGYGVEVTKIHEWTVIKREWVCDSSCRWENVERKSWKDIKTIYTEDELETWGMWERVTVDEGPTTRYVAYHHTTAKLRPIERPGSGWVFDHWKGACAGSSVCKLRIDKDLETTARFWRVRNFKLHVVDGGGSPVGCTVNLDFRTPRNTQKAPEPDGSYGDGWSHVLYQATWVTPTPNSCPGYQFDHWELTGASWSGNRFKIREGDVELKAVFWKVVDVKVEVVDQGGSSIPSCKVGLQFNLPDNADHAPDYSGQYSDGATLNDVYKDTEITATPLSCPDYRFDHWEVTGASGDPGSGITVGDSDVTIRAVYWKQVTLDFDIQDDSGGAVGADLHLTFTQPRGASHPNVPREGDYGNGDSLTMDIGTGVSASPNSFSGYQFDHWTGACTGTGSCTFNMDGDKTLGAVYWKTYQLTVNVDDDQGNDPGATLNLQFTAPGGASQAPDPDGDYHDGNTVTLYRGTQVLASPNGLAGYQFDHWTQTCSGTGACSFSMDGDKTLGALYWKLVDLDVEVKDELGTSVGCTVHMDFTHPFGAQSSPPDPDGDYHDGNTVSDLYRGTTVSPSYHSCSGYRFDHWELDGSTWSGSSFSMDDDRTVKAVYWKQYNLAIKVNPPAAGDTRPLSAGSYKIDRGKTVSLTATPNAGWEFDHWELDGSDEGSRPTLTFTMNGDHDVVAHFKKKEEKPSLSPTVPVAAPAYKGCALPAEFPKGMKYKGMYADLQYNRDLLRNLKEASLSQEKNLIMLGGPNAIPYPWEQYDVYFEGNALKVKDQAYTASYGERDYGTILFDCDNMVVRVAGVNRLGTRAALMWLLNHPDEANGKLLIVVEWVDANHDHQVQEGEIRVIHELP